MNTDRSRLQGYVPSEMGSAFRPFAADLDSRRAYALRFGTTRLKCDPKLTLNLGDRIEDRRVRAAREKEADRPMVGVHDEGTAVAALGQGRRHELIAESRRAGQAVEHADGRSDRRDLAFRDPGRPAALPDPHPNRPGGRPGDGPDLQDFVGYVRVVQRLPQGGVHDVPHGPRDAEEAQEEVQETVEDDRYKRIERRDPILVSPAVVRSRLQDRVPDRRGVRVREDMVVAEDHPDAGAPRHCGEGPCRDPVVADADPAGGGPPPVRPRLERLNPSRLDDVRLHRFDLRRNQILRPELCAWDLPLDEDDDARLVSLTAAGDLLGDPHADDVALSEQPRLVNPWDALPRHSPIGWRSSL